MKNELNIESGRVVERVVSLLEKARSTVVRTITAEMAAACRVISERFRLDESAVQYGGVL